MNKEFLKKLLETASPSGFEKEAADLWKAEAKLFTDNVYGDIHGNSFAKILGSKESVIMLAGHIDEIGLMVTYVSEGGFLYFAPIGGWDAQILPGQRVNIHTKIGKIIKGVIGRSPIHSLKPDERERGVKMEDLWIDTGLGKEALEIITVGDYAVVDYNPEFLGKTLVSRGIDDKIGAFVAFEVLRKIHETTVNLYSTICAVATVQEEIGLRGAITSAYGLNPTVGIAIDVTFATDYPNANKRQIGDICLGKGPVISIGPNITPMIYEKLVKVAKDNNIPCQIEAAPRGTGTDANAIQLTRAGVATGLVSIPNRYMHSPCEMSDLEDVENAIKLLTHFCLLPCF